MTKPIHLDMTTPRGGLSKTVHIVTDEPFPCNYLWTEEVVDHEYPRTTSYMTHCCPKPVGHDGPHGCWIEGCEAAHP